MNEVSQDVAAVISAAGSSVRMDGVKKEYCYLGAAKDSRGRPLSVLGAAVSAFTHNPHIRWIVITVPQNPEQGEEQARKCLPEDLIERDTPHILFVRGGKSRQISVYNALKALAPYKPDYALIHDGARPWVSTALIDRLIAGVASSQALIPITPLLDTPKQIGEGGLIKRHLKRSNVMLAQTPQAFAFAPLLQAHERAYEKAYRDSAEYTDDAELWAEFAGPVYVIPGARENRKITFREDLYPHAVETHE